MLHASLKYVDIIRQRTSKWANWSPEKDDIRVGSYGRFNAETGRLDVLGNVYDPEFQKLIDATDGKLKLSDYPPVLDDEEKDFAVGTMGVRPKDFSPGPNDVEHLDKAKYKQDWQFLPDKRGAILVMHKPRQEHFPKGRVFEALYKVPELKDLCIVPTVYKCRAYAVYLSNKTGEKVSLALLPKSGEENETGLNWWTNTQEEHLQLKTDEDYVFSPLFTCKRKIPLIRPLMRDSPTPDPEDAGFWMDSYPTWEPLDEDGEIDPVYDDDYDDPNVYNPRRDAPYVPYSPSPEPEEEEDD
ncbi:hypothetical protein DEU56DRAFT_918094 [Suillus clintonianus]|uniref:uncharacterized protein n=1 Tax=Suillus clintonianus TaxID=1904413 RepID=UPI001B85E027|nr:uncharacterized protein DEU56DRAFT_918094 [Suillus clintonianus]KAG2121753.1 hypothetical protein DEU56DRAFT_918094 [Suillus clintonianus]